MMAMLQLFFLHTKNSELKDQLTSAQSERFEMFKVADRLRQSSDELTRFARMYVVTGNMIYKNNYYHVLNIRSGLAPRPENYFSIYWDFLEPKRSEKHPDGKPLSLNKLLDALPYTPQERDKLKSSYEHSQELVELEEKAFDLMKSVKQNSSGKHGTNHTLEQLHAIDLLFSDRYMDAKQEIMEPIDDFFILLDKRTLTRVTTIKDRLLFYNDTLKYVIILFYLINLAILIWFHRNVIQVISYIISAIQNSKGTILFLDRSLEKSPNELGMLIQEFNTMSTILEEKELQQEHLNEELSSINQNLNHQVEIEVQQRMQIEMEYRQKERLLIQRSKMADMGEMIGAIVHQWKQPLNIISGTVQQLGFIDHTNIHEKKEELADIERSVLKQVFFMNDTMEYFRNFFSPKSNPIVFDACSAILEIKEMFSGVFEKQSIKIEIQDEIEIPVNGKKNEFSQVILNIFNNSKEAYVNKTEGEKKIICSFDRSGERHFAIHIRDNAGGIPEALLPDRIFENYVTTKGEKGTGIGLHLSKIIVEQNLKGRIYARNIEQGALFTIELPISGNSSGKEEDKS